MTFSYRFGYLDKIRNMVWFGLILHKLNREILFNVGLVNYDAPVWSDSVYMWEKRQWRPHLSNRERDSWLTHQKDSGDHTRVVVERERLLIDSSTAVSWSKCFCLLSRVFLFRCLYKYKWNVCCLRNCIPWTWLLLMK